MNIARKAHQLRLQMHEKAFDLGWMGWVERHNMYENVFLI